MKFSIIMVSYNQVRYIKQAIDSMIKQTYQNFELIIIDGMSDAGTQEIIKEYINYPNIKIIIEKDQGMYHARNKGLFLANGDIIGFLNSDDFFKADALEQILKCYNANSDVDIVYGISHIVDKEGEFIRLNGNFEFDKDKLIKEYIALPDEATFFKRENLSRIGLYDSTFSIVADWDFWQRAMKLNLKFIHLNKYIANYRHYSDTLTFNPKFVKIRFQEVTRLYRKYNDVCISPFLIKVYYWHYIKRPIKNNQIINRIYKIFVN